jgi:hypothetical protein
MGYMGGTTTKVGKAILIQSQAPGASGIDLYVQNVGQGSVTFDPSGSVYINDELQPLLPEDFDKLTLNLGETAWIQTNYPWSQSFKAKIVTTEGTFTEKTGYYENTGGSVAYSVEFILGTGGSSMAPTEGTHSYGGNIAISATPATDYVFAEWIATGSITFADSHAASTTATINGPGTITATFTYSPTQYDVTFALGSGGASINPSAGVHTYDAGASVAISATADGTHGFSQWTATGSITFDDANAASTTAHINGGGSITANFSPFALDGSASTNTVTSNTMTITLTTTQPNDVLYLSWVGNGGDRYIISVTSPDTSVWMQRARISRDSDHWLETWYATKSTAGTTTITITMDSDSSTNCAAVAFGISGANTASPFDGNARTSTGHGNLAQIVNVVTSNPNDFLIGAMGAETWDLTPYNSLVAQNSFTLIRKQTVGSSRFTADEYRIVPAGTYTPKFDWNGGYYLDWGMIVDAIKKGP